MTKLLFLIDTGLSGGGAERVLCNLVNALDPARFDVTVMTLWPQDPAPYLLPHVHYRSVYPRRDALTRQLYRLEAQLGIAARRLPGDCDIEIAYLEAGPTKVIASSKTAAKKVAWVHCDLRRRSDFEDFRKKADGWYRRYDHVVCVSGSVRDSFLDAFPDAVPAGVLYNINDEKEILDKSVAFDIPKAGVPVICAVGRLSPEKGFDRLLLACSRLKREGIPFRLQIIGEGEERPALEQLIRQEALDGQVQLPGWQSNPYPWMKAADVIVCSSVYEGLSTVVTEALILGRPIVTTPCAGMDELLGREEYGIITDDLHAGLKRMLTDPDLRARYAAAAKRRGLDFRKEVLTRKTEAFFTDLKEGTRSE